MKKIAHEINLSCIASYVAGAYTTFLINFFWFDNHITPPGVSAFVASLALLFTIYAAFKVKEWNEQKMNEKAFSVADKIIEHLNQSYVDFMFASSHLINLLEKEKIGNLEEERDTLENYESHIKKSGDEFIKCVNLIDTLSVWKYKADNKSDFYTFRHKTNIFNRVAMKALFIYVSPSENNIDQFKSFKDELKAKRSDVKSSYEEITKISFDKIFTSIDIK